jgi:aldose 1-epimerase
MGIYTPVSSVPAYDFQESKVIGKDFPEGGYGTLTGLRASVKTCADPA